MESSDQWTFYLVDNKAVGHLMTVLSLALSDGSNEHPQMLLIYTSDQMFAPCPPGQCLR